MLQVLKADGRGNNDGGGNIISCLFNEEAIRSHPHLWMAKRANALVRRAREGEESILGLKGCHIDIAIIDPETNIILDFMDERQCRDHWVPESLDPYEAPIVWQIPDDEPRLCKSTEIPKRVYVLPEDVSLIHVPAPKTWNVGKINGHRHKGWELAEVFNISAEHKGRPVVERSYNELVPDYLGFKRNQYKEVPAPAWA